MKSPTVVKVAAIQSRCQQSHKDNVQQAVAKVEEVTDRGAEVICLQELFASQYFCQTEDHRNFDLAESIPGPTTEYLCETAAKHGVVIVAGLFERRAAGLFHNTAVVIDADGTIPGVHRKLHIPEDPGFHEKFYFTPGEPEFHSTPTRFGKIGVGVCWDQWFPETARLLALSGAEILVYPTAIGWLDEDRHEFGTSQLNAWQTMMRAHAIANGVFVVAPNRAGRENLIQFWGSSFICDPYGRTLVEALPEEPDSIMADCDLNHVGTARTHWPFLRDRRVDAYAGLLERWLDD